MATDAEIQVKITEAENAYHDLLLGNRIVTITAFGKTTSYTQAKAADLKNYINHLKSQLSTGKSGPIHILL